MTIEKQPEPFLPTAEELSDLAKNFYETVGSTTVWKLSDYTHAVLKKWGNH